MFAFISFYGCIGFFSTEIGFRKGWEVYVIVMPGVGAAMGPVIASSRSLFSTLIPPGLETEFFRYDFPPKK